MIRNPRSLHLSGAPRGSGSDIAARRLRKALLAEGVGADWISPDNQQQGDNPIVPSAPLYWTHSPRLSRLLGRAVDRLDHRRVAIHLSITPGLRSGAINSWPADLIHIHWLGTGFLSLLSLPKLRKPLVWTLHDLWPLLGIRNYPPKESESSHNSIFHLDLDPFAKAVKRLSFPSQLQFIAPSEWAAKQAEATSLFHELPQLRPIRIIPNALDPVFLRPSEAGSISRKNSCKPMLLFGASNAFSDARKGWHFLEPLLPYLTKAYPHWRLATFGEAPPKGWHSDMPCKHYGPIHDPNHLAALYREASLMVVPSLQETFGQVAAEAQACGVPVVALADSGVASLLKHGKTGFLIRESTSGALLEGLCFFMDQEPRRLALASLEASLNAKNSFAPDIVAKAHHDLYAELLS